jgi:hypothetical protein
VADAVASLWEAFLGAYCDALGDAKSALWTKSEERGAGIHFGAEILVRAVGPFQAGYVYDGLSPDHPVLQDAVQTAARALRTPGSVDVLGA